MSTSRPLFLLAGGVLAAVIVFAWYKRPEAASARLAESAQPDRMAPVTAKLPTDVQPESVEAGARSLTVAEPSSPEPSVPETLETIRALGAGAEQALVLSESGMRFEMTKTLMDDVHFDEFIDAVDSGPVGQELQAGLLPLIYEWADTNGIAVDRLACGEKVCVLRVYGPSRDALESYVQSVTDASEGMVLSKNWKDSVKAPNWIERRIIFATDQSVNGFLFEDSGG
ncbi:MAG: hypothetical protein AAF545_12485 [Pseudomonadota bacterium]